MPGFAGMTAKFENWSILQNSKNSRKNGI